MKGICCFCEREVGKLEAAAYKVSGWTIERPRGLNALYDKQVEPDVIAHESCLREQKHKGQTNLFGQAA